VAEVLKVPIVLPSLGSVTKCRKCNRDTWNEYHPLMCASMTHRPDGHGGCGYIERRCLRCGYRWHEAAADTPELPIDLDAQE